MLQPWFQHAKLGIFIHWGLYSVNGIPESWSFFNEQISYDDYMAQKAGFTASAYDPEAWADLFQRAGARYAVLTTKHHDGVALWDTQHSDWSVVKQTPAERDLIGPYVEALRKRGLHVGLYFSHLDWSHPDYAPMPPAERVASVLDGRAYAAWPEGPSRPEWQRFLAFRDAQLHELCKHYNPDLLWFDGDWTPNSEWWQMAELREKLHTWQPGVMLNGRMKGFGDYATPEQGVPTVAPDGPWEFCVTVNDSWGYQTNDHNHKSPRQIIRMFAEVIGMGGNMLLDIGPKADGSILPEHVERLEALGDWIRRHKEAVYPTGAGLPPGLFYGASTLSHDRATLYAILFDRPWDQIAIKGIRNTVMRVSVLGTGRELIHQKIGGAPWMNIPGVLWVDLPESELDQHATVIKIELDGPLDLYHGAGHAIERN